MKKELSFEDKIERLQVISQELEEKSTDLAVSVKLYQESQVLLKSCKSELAKAKHLIENSTGEFLASSDDFLAQLQDRE